MVSAGHVGGTCSSGIVSDVIWMSLVRGMRGDIVKYVRCVCVWLGVAWVERGVSG